MAPKADIGVFGGSGFYSFLSDVKEIEIKTPYGPTSGRIALANVSGKAVAFLPRHGKKHQLPPHVINYRANVHAMKELGVKRIIAPCAAGSLQPHVKRGDFVICDQFVDRTKGRKDTFFDGPQAYHISSADPYCPELRKTAYSVTKGLGIPVHEKGTVVVIQGPRFSTKAESRWFTGMGWEVINMTQYPEAVLAREAEICFCNISLITDYDAGLVGGEIKPVTVDEMIKIFTQNNEKLKKVLFGLIEKIPEKRGCGCGEALKGAKV
jgi:5'-methylthioadenosine phosphorylase